MLSAVQSAKRKAHINRLRTGNQFGRKEKGKRESGMEAGVDAGICSLIGFSSSAAAVSLLSTAVTSTARLLMRGCPSLGSRKRQKRTDTHESQESEDES